MECKRNGDYAEFKCGACREPCRVAMASGQGRAYCENCGAIYAVFVRADGTLHVQGITLDEMYLPPLEWSNIYAAGFDSGRWWELNRRRERRFWHRIKDFIRNE